MCCTKSCNIRLKRHEVCKQPFAYCQGVLLTLSSPTASPLNPHPSCPTRSGSATRGQSVLGDVPSKPVTFVENGVQFRADVVVGQKTGFFLDQRDNRQRMQVGAGSGDRQAGF